MIGTDYFDISRIATNAFPFGPHYLQGENRMFEHAKELYIELSSLENRGVTIWLEGSPSDSFGVTSQLNIHEENEYMRDYVFEEGRLKEVHFDKIETHSKKE